MNVLRERECLMNDMNSGKSNNNSVIVVEAEIRSSGSSE